MTEVKAKRGGVAPHQHGIVASEKLKGRLPDHCIHAIRSHDNRTGLKAENKLDKALVASDSLANLIEKMDKTASELSVTTLRAELKNVSLRKTWFKNTSGNAKSSESGWMIS